MWGQTETTDEATDTNRRNIPTQSDSVSLQYQGFEILDQSVEPTGGVRTGELPDFDTIVEQLWGVEFNFKAGDQDRDDLLTEEEISNLLMKHSVAEEEAKAWATILFHGGDVNRDSKVSYTELKVLHYAPLIEHQIKNAYLNDGSTHVQITFGDESLTDLVNTFAYFVATLRVEGYPDIETDILSLEREVDIDPLYFDQNLLPNLKNKAAFNLTNQTIKSEGKVVAMGINLCLFELNCIVRVGRFDGDDNLILSKAEWQVAKDSLFPEDDQILSMTQNDKTFDLESVNRTPTFELLDTNTDRSVTVAEIIRFLRESIAEFGDLEL